MGKPTILAADDDPMVSAAIARDLGSRYGTDYRAVRAISGPEALTVMARLALRAQPVALIAADQRLPRMSGIEMPEQPRTHAPGAKLLLLTAYADTDVAIRAINDIGLDYCLLKPWDPPEDRLCPVIDDLPGDWRRAIPEQVSAVRVAARALVVAAGGVLPAPGGPWAARAAPSAGHGSAVGESAMPIYLVHRYLGTV